VQVSLSGAEDIRPGREQVLPSPDPATSLGESCAANGTAAAAFPATRGNSLDDLYQAERSLLDGYAVIPAFPFAGGEYGECPRARLGTGSTGGVERHGAFVADVWLADSRPADSHANDARPEASSR